MILHAAGAKKPTNTGRLAALCTDNSRVRVRGLPDEPLDLGFLAGQRGLVLCRDDSATILQPSALPVTSIVPDGG